MTSEQQHWPEYSDIPAYDRPPERVYGDEEAQERIVPLPVGRSRMIPR